METVLLLRVHDHQMYLFFSLDHLSTTRLHLLLLTPLLYPHSLYFITSVTNNNLKFKLHLFTSPQKNPQQIESLQQINNILTRQDTVLALTVLNTFTSVMLSQCLLMNGLCSAWLLWSTSYLIAVNRARLIEVRMDQSVAHDLASCIYMPFGV